ncbi:hypothetical protein AB0L56_07225 [Streptomyces sp. NPDC052079]|uniref:hypothetical protein n=1 Tax=Streptomyces sp. NPDC052079 TaxID=3155526 RepID=UPI00343FFC20
MGSRGLRRGEAVGQDWQEIDLDVGLITPAKEIVVDGWDTYESEPKTDGSANTIALDNLNITTLRDHKARQEKERSKFLRDLPPHPRHDRPATRHPAGPAPRRRDADARRRRRHPHGEGDLAALHHHADLGHIREPAPWAGPRNRGEGNEADPQVASGRC